MHPIESIGRLHTALTREQLINTVCEKLGSKVVYATSYSTLEMSHPAKYTRMSTIPNAPADCPLLSPPGERSADQFQTCGQCPYGTTKPTG